MNRRQALLAILLAPAAVPIQEPTHVGTVSYSAGLRAVLADNPGDGVTFLEVTYKGKSKKFSAKEIWEALQGEAC